MEAKEPGQRSAVKAASRRSRSRAARALTALRWFGSGLQCDHGRTSRRARATRRHAANDGARNVDFECFLGSSGTRPLHAVPLRAIQINVQTNTCHPRRPRATSSLLSCRPNRSRSAPSSRSVRSGIVDSGRQGGLGNIDANDPKRTLNRQDDGPNSRDG
jgi:hypothetical protein